MYFAEKAAQDTLKNIEETRVMRSTKIDNLRIAYDSLASSTLDIVNKAGIKSYNDYDDYRAKHLFLSKIKGFLIKAPIYQDNNLIHADVQFTSKTDKSDTRIVNINEKLLPNIFTSDPELYIDEVYKFIEFCMSSDTEDVTIIIFKSGEDIVSMLYYSETDDVWKYNKIQTFNANVE